MENHPSAMPGTDPGRRSGLESAAVFDAASLPALLRAPLPEALQRLLEVHIRTRRWFRGKARTIRQLEIVDQLPLGTAPGTVTLILIRVSYLVEDPEVYVLPLACAVEAERTPADSRLFELADTAHATARRIVYDPSGHPDLPHALLDLFVRDQTSGDRGRIRATATTALTARVRSAQPRLDARQSTGEQSNTTVFFGQEFMLKLFRQLEAGENPDVELNEFLWAHGYRHVPEPLGSIRYEGPALVATLGIAQRFVPGDGTAWDATLEILHRSLDRARAMDPPPAHGLGDGLLDDGAGEPHWQSSELVAPYAGFATLLGERTAELHMVLACDAEAPAFKPEPFTIEYQHSLVQAARERLDGSCDLLARQLARLPNEVEPLAEEVFACRGRLRASLDACDSMAVSACRIRCHGDYHLGQVLHGSGDFTVLDFEGEPAQPLALRRQKGSALYDVCGMLRSFHYAGTVAWQSDRWRLEDRTSLRNWSEAWCRRVSALFLSAYLKRAHAAGVSPVFLPESRDELRRLLRLHLIDKCSYELSYELNNRPAWVGVPMAGLIGLANAH
jgi:maltose alpha-D-glucosyltransferase/alpha-amylase